MAKLIYITHPNVEINPDVPVAQWGLNQTGIDRAERMLSQPWVSDLSRVISSEEAKAIETAAILAGRLGFIPQIRPTTGENDRTATGFVPPEQFETLANAFFARPTESVRGWERAVDAQARIVGGLADLIGANASGSGDTAIVGHGGVGTLWYCHLAGLPIDRRYDQPGQGHFFTVEQSTGNPLHGWHPIDSIQSRT